MSDLVNKIDSLYQSLPGAQSSYKDRLTRGQSSPRNGYTTGQRSQKDGLDKRSASIEVESLVREPSRGQRSQSINIGGHRSLEQSDDPKAVVEIRLLHSSMESRWGDFERDLRQYSTRLDLSLKFHEVLFEVGQVYMCVWLTYWFVVVKIGCELM